jgi:hypothetical protein
MALSKGPANGQIRHKPGGPAQRRQSGLYLPKARSRITNGQVLLSGVDQRSLWMRRFRDIHALHVQDLGGADALSQAQASLVRRIACLSVEAERLEMLFAQEQGASDHKLQVYYRLADVLRRLLKTVGLKRVARDITPSLHDIMTEAREAAE